MPILSARAIREFLTSRRARITREQAGLRSYGGRHVRGLHREEVAVLAGVSVITGQVLPVDGGVMLSK